MENIADRNRKERVDAIIRARYDNLGHEAEIIFHQGKNPHGSLEDYLQALKKHWVSYSEYMYQYEFWKLTEEERDKYVSRLRMQSFYHHNVSRSIQNLFKDKVAFLKLFSEYVHRDWLRVKDSSYDDFFNLLSKADCIAKPINGTCGKGIQFIPKNDASVNKDELKEMFGKMQYQDILLEENIRGAIGLQSFHPSSLNTIRVVTISNGEKAEIIKYAGFRTGRGRNFVDNTHAGGIISTIDANTGIIVSDGFDINGYYYVTHPDSNLPFKGFKIDGWESVRNTCLEAAKTTLNPITGWDVTINTKGQVELIEGNHAPDFDGVLQAPLKCGIKDSIAEKIRTILGMDLMKDSQVDGLN